MSTSTDADEPEDDSINQILFEDSGCFKGGYASINAAPDARIAMVDATGDYETVANSTFEAAVAPDDGAAEDLDPKSGLCRLSVEQPANVQTDEFEPTSKSPEVDHEGALKSFEASPPHSSLWPGSLLEISQEIPDVSIPIIATNDSHLPEQGPNMAILRRHPEVILATSTLRPILPASTSMFDPATCGAFLNPVAEEEAASSTSNHYFADLPPANPYTSSPSTTKPKDQRRSSDGLSTFASRSVVRRAFPWLRRSSSRIPTPKFDPTPLTPIIDSVSVERANESRIRDLLDIKHLTTEKLR